MAKPGIQTVVPGVGPIILESLVTDYSGTLTCGGKLTAGVQERLIRLAELIDIFVLTSDTFGTVRFELQNIPLNIQVLAGERHDKQKREFVREHCNPAEIAALGNGANDRQMLHAVRDAGGLSVAVDNGEGCSLSALQNASLLIHGAAAALDLLLDPNRIKATLRV
jgi:soluble P-type ATPase